MEVFNFGVEEGNKIHNYDSVSAFYSKILRTDEPTNIGFINIEKDGFVGYHEAPVQQLFVVVQGEGWVEGEDGKRVMLKGGEGVFWRKGEGHISGSETGLTALVVQSANLRVTP
ncbi:cupin domain-containing protein [Oceanobacillus kapialis]|uniref:Cupin n=1 Tax=Oceanobacillus kapialis TaxID=481353 RepID=A0ABW5Q2S6_9BACI